MLPFTDCLSRSNTLNPVPTPRPDDKGRPTVGRFHSWVKLPPFRLLRAFSQNPDGHLCCSREHGKKILGRTTEGHCSAFIKGSAWSIMASVRRCSSVNTPHPQLLPTTWHYFACHRALSWVFKIIIATMSDCVPAFCFHHEPQRSGQN